MDRHCFYSLIVQLLTTMVMHACTKRLFREYTSHVCKAVGYTMSMLRGYFVSHSSLIYIIL